MAVRRILRMGHPHLRRVADPLPVEQIGSPDFERLLADMRDTLRDYGGVGLAAPQIDESVRVAIIELGEIRSRYGDVPRVPLTTFINPEIEVLDDKRAGYWEGCLSVPGLRGFVTRPQHVRIRYTDTEGEQCSLTLEGFPATVVQHEFDHLDGTLYVDRVAEPQFMMFEDELARHQDHWQTLAERG